MSKLVIRLVAAMGVGGFLVGCSAVTGTSGDEGTVDLVKAQQTAAKSSNPAFAKKAQFSGMLGLAKEKAKKQKK